MCLPKHNVTLTLAHRQEYLYMLCEALRRLGGDEGKVEEDVYLTELERLVRAEDQRLQRSEESI